MVGIIAEYNPFHEGHKYHIEQAKKLSGEKHAVVIMSGDYVQRGEPAVVDKYTRAKMALAEGADYVFELPLKYALSSAEKFAYGGVLALHQLSAVKALCFGSETADMEKLKAAADFFVKEPLEYKTCLSQYLQEGVSFPVARERAYCQVNRVEAAKQKDLFLPNNILGIEYLKAMKKIGVSFKPLCISREGAGYLEEALDVTYPSATAIRKSMREGRILGVSSRGRDILEQALAYVVPEDFYELVSYAIREKWDQLETYQDVSTDLANCIRKAWEESTSLEQLCDTIKGKNITMSRVKRCLFQILFDIKKEENESLSFLRLLGMRTDCKEPLEASCQVLGGLAKGMDALSDRSQRELARDVKAADWYRKIQQKKASRMRTNEYQTPVIRM